MAGEQKIRAVLFDLGGTLCHLPEAVPMEVALEGAAARLSQLLAAWGFGPARRFEGLARDIYFAAWAAELEAYRTSCVLPSFPAVAQEVADRAGIQVGQAQAEALWEACRIDERPFGRRPAPDAIDTLRWLKQRGFKLGCVTNTLFGGPPLLEGLRADGLGDYLEAVAISCDLGYLKPHPKIFQQALRALGVWPHEAVMVGDSLRADVAGAKALGMTAVWKRRDDALARAERAWEQKTGLSPRYEPDCVIDRLWEVTQLGFLQA